MTSFSPLKSFMGLVTLITLVAGCSQPEGPDEGQGNSFQQLSIIGQCYMEYSDTNRKAPKSKDDILQLLTNAS